MVEKDKRQAALDYHEFPRPGKTAIALTKPCDTQYDLALAYTPGVAVPVNEIAKDKEAAYRYTNKGNLVAVITNGTAVLGLGNTGSLAGKPVMEGKAVLFKRFADIDVFDIEVDTESPQSFIDTVVRISSGFGGINLEDIAAPHCFEIEVALQERLDIPVFHDDQHGTAIIVAAALLNALEIQGKSIDQIKIVCVGAGSAGIASMSLLHTMGVSRANITLVDREGVIHNQRKNLSIYKKLFAQDTEQRTLKEAMCGTDVFIGVAGPNLVDKDMLMSMAANPIVFALSNPDPEISPDFACLLRDDLIIATGRSDFPNQVNNVLCFPYIFRGALDVRASCINQEMMQAAVYAICKLTHEPVPEEVLIAYQLKELSFGKNYILPTALDPRLLKVVSSAVSKAAISSGVAKIKKVQK